MWRFAGLLVACSTPLEAPPLEPAPHQPPRNACVGLWKLAETRVTSTTCSGLGPRKADLIVDVADGRYRVRHLDGGWLEVKSASPLDAPCALVVREGNADFDMEWRIVDGGASAVYRDTEAWTECRHEVAATAVRRDLVAADTAFHADDASKTFAAWWRQFPQCHPIHSKLPEVVAEVVIAATGEVQFLRWEGQKLYVSCSMHSCHCPQVINRSGTAQRITVRLPMT